MTKSELLFNISTTHTALKGLRLTTTMTHRVFSQFVSVNNDFLLQNQEE